MSRCRVSPAEVPSPMPVRPSRSCRTTPQEAPLVLPTAGLAVDLSVEELRARLKNVPNDETVRPYAVTTVRIRKNIFLQTGSAPNFAGGVVTLCTCKHQMRGNYNIEQWTSGVWVVGLTSMSESPGKDQNLYYLMRVSRAYESHAELVAGLQASGQQSVVDAKAASRHRLGDILLPLKHDLAGEVRFSPASYEKPMLGHVHRSEEYDSYWHKDVDYAGRANRPPLLIGDPELSFVWTNPLVKRRHSSAIRDYEKWTLSHLISQLDNGVAA